MNVLKRHTHVKVVVTLSEREYKHLLKERAATPDGTVENVIRERLGYWARPYAYTKDPVVLTESAYLRRESNGATSAGSS